MHVFTQMRFFPLTYAYKTMLIWFISLHICKFAHRLSLLDASGFNFCFEWPDNYRLRRKGEGRRKTLPAICLTVTVLQRILKVHKSRVTVLRQGFSYRLLSHWYVRATSEESTLDIIDEGAPSQAKL